MGKTTFLIIIAASVFSVSQVSAATHLPLTITGSRSAQTLFAPQLSTSHLVGVPTNDFALVASATSTALTGPYSSTVADAVISNSGTSVSLSTLAISSNSEAPLFLNVTPSVISLDSIGNISYVNDGTAQVDVTVAGRTKAARFGVSHTISTTTLSGYTAGSLANAIYAPIASDVTGLATSSSVQDIYSSINDSAHIYTRNASILTKSLDLTSIPVYNSLGTSEFGGMLVAPDILIMANHAPLPNGTTVYFVDNNDVTSSRTILSGMEASTTDIYVARLSSPVASGISFAKVLPKNAESAYLSSWFASTTLNGVKEALPFFVTNQDRSVYIDNFLQFGKGIDSDHQIITTEALDASYPSWGWGWQVISGDSGSPVFISISGQTVLVGTWSSISFNYYCSDVSYYYTEINEAMTSLGSSYQLTPVDLSGYTTY